MAKETNTKAYYLVAIMKGTYPDGGKDVFVFKEQSFNSSYICSQYLKENSFKVVITLSYVFGARRDFEQLICVNEEKIAHRLPKTKELWRVLE